MHSLARPLLLLALAAGCASTRASAPDEVRDLIDHGRYEDAVAVAARESAARPGDAAARELHRKATVAFLLEQGRELTFADRDVEALRVFARALEVDPDSTAVRAWVEKTKLKLAERWIETALELHANDDLEAAVDAYEHALRFSPGDESAINGMASAVIQINYRNGLGKRYFEDGMRSLAARWLENARSRFSYAEKYKPDEPRTIVRRGEVDRMLAGQRAAVGRDFEAAQRFAAARNEYRLALALDPENAEARDGLERAGREARAAQMVKDAEMEIVRGRFEQAHAQLDEAAKLTVAQADLVEGARARVQEARFQTMYDEALALEHDKEYEAAIAKYGELLAETDYFKDVIARRGTLEEYVTIAAQNYEAAEKAATDAEKLDHLRRIELIWPEYRDVAARIAALEAAQAAPPSPPSPPSSGS